MKKSFITKIIGISIVSASLFAFVSCSKEQEEPIDKTETPIENIDKYDYIFPNLSRRWIMTGLKKERL